MVHLFFLPELSDMNVRTSLLRLHLPLPSTCLQRFTDGLSVVVAFPGNGPAASECVTATYDALPTFNHGYWRINASGIASGTYRISLYNSGMSNNTGMGWTAVKAPSGTGLFSLSGACFIASTAAQTRRDNMTGFSDFATVQSQNPLPIELLYFDAEDDGDDVVCKWSTATEINNDYFMLERSYDYEIFTPVVKINGYGSGVSGQVLSYRYVDEGICSGTLYYRLKQVDIDGAFTYSDVVAVKCVDGKTDFMLFPNPVDEKLIIQSRWMSVSQPGGESILFISVYDMLGEKVMEVDFNHVPSNQSHISEVDVQSLPAGLYMLVCKTEGVIFRSKFVKR
jgi:hypothetical protein